jgi:alpha-ketoglutarate-dependent taurine dioxygenase
MVFTLFNNYNRLKKEEPLTAKQLEAVDYLDLLLDDPAMAYFFLIQEGEVAFVNNHQVLHSRSDFKDPERHLIRVRMN